MTMAASCVSASGLTATRLGSIAPSRVRPGSTSRPSITRVTRAQAANPNGHNHRGNSPTRLPSGGAPRPGSPVGRGVDKAGATKANGGATGVTTTGTSADSRPTQRTSMDTGPLGSKTSPSPTATSSSKPTRSKRTSVRSSASTNAGFQRTSWYGAVSDQIPVGSSKTSSTRISAHPNAGSGPGPNGGGVVNNPAVVKQGSGSNPTKDASTPSSSETSISKKPSPAMKTPPPSKPFKEPSSSDKAIELSLPRQSEVASSNNSSADKDSIESGKKKGSLTRLLRTPLSGGVLNSMKDADLPSVAVAARNLMELADYADLSTIMSNMNHRRTGYPFASTVDFATDGDGYPVFCLTPLAMHTRNLAYNSRASLTVKMNGWGGLANARVTIFGDVHRLPPEYQTSANEIFKAKYAARKEESDLDDRWGDYTFYRMNKVIDVYFVGGFGTLNWVDLNEYRSATPDKIVTPGAGHSVLDTLSELNTKYGGLLAKSGAVLGNSIAPNETAEEAANLFHEVRVDDLWIISIDRMGIDVRVRLDGISQVRRINFMGCVETYSDACEALDAIVKGEVWQGGECV